MSHGPGAKHDFAGGIPALQVDPGEPALRERFGRLGGCEPASMRSSRAACSAVITKSVGGSLTDLGSLPRTGGRAGGRRLIARYEDLEQVGRLLVLAGVIEHHRDEGAAAGFFGGGRPRVERLKTNQVNFGASQGSSWSPRPALLARNHLDVAVESPPIPTASRDGWRGRIRTFDLLIQSQAPYRLATRQWNRSA